MQSKISDVSFSIEFRFETEIGCLFTRLGTFHIAICPYIFPSYKDTRSIAERTPHSHIQRYFCHKHDAHERICLSIFFSQRNSCSFLLFHFFFFEFYQRQPLYLLFLPPDKTNTKCCEKNEKCPQWYHLDVAHMVCS